jgi:recombination protein RecA
MREDLQAFLDRARAQASPTAAAAKLVSLDELARASPRRAPLTVLLPAAPDAANSSALDAAEAPTSSPSDAASSSTSPSKPPSTSSFAPALAAKGSPPASSGAARFSRSATASPAATAAALRSAFSTRALSSGASLAVGLATAEQLAPSYEPAPSPALARSLDPAALRAAAVDEAAVEAAADRLGFEVLRGRLIELSGEAATAVLTAAIGLVLEAQRAAEPVAWVTLQGTSFYPPDVVECGVDLAALAVVRVPDSIAAGRTAERLLRSGAFGLVILDLGGPDCVIERDGILRAGTRALSIANQGRLGSLAQHADSLVVCITNKKRSTESLGSLISLRADASRERDNDGFRVKLRVLKDKRRGPGWSRSERAKGPSGLT